MSGLFIDGRYSTQGDDPELMGSKFDAYQGNRISQCVKKPSPETEPELHHSIRPGYCIRMIQQAQQSDNLFLVLDSLAHSIGCDPLAPGASESMT